MKAILISIKPKWVAKILNGEKIIEIRKTMPKCDLPIDVYIYCTKDRKKGWGMVGINGNETYYQKYDKNAVYSINHNYIGNGKVVAKFTLNKVEEIICRPICGEWESYTKTLGYSEISQASCLGNREIVHYLKGKKGYAWHISNLEIFDKPKEISEFYHYVKYNKEMVILNKQDWDFVKLNKAPQSFCYVEVE